MSQVAANWYVVNTLSGHEKKVAKAIQDVAEQKGLTEKFEQVVVPVESAIEVKKGQKVSVEKKCLPGYILVKMELDDITWHLVRNIPKVSGFLGANSKPQAMSELEAQRMLNHMAEAAEKPKKSYSFAVGENVKIVEGPFESFVGVIEELDEDKSRLKVMVSIFGRSTPVDLEFSQVEKV